MRVIIFLGGLLVLFSNVAMALPSGTYQQSCQRCYLYDGTLRCHCLDQTGGYQRTQLEHANYCRDIRNVKGQLACHRFHHSFLPEGNYRQTCKACRLTAFKLTCQCQNHVGTWQQTTLSLYIFCHSGVENIDGTLRCHRAADRPLPPGPYQQVCQRCRFDGFKLSCECSAQNRQMQNAHLFGAGRCNYIEFVQGKLRCD